MNWQRIIANAGLTFCTALIGFTGAIGLGEPAFFGALFTSLIQGGVAGFTEMKEDCEEPPRKTTLSHKARKAFATALII